MRNLFKWIGIALGGLIGLPLLAATILYLSADARMNRTFRLVGGELPGRRSYPQEHVDALG